jgi:hypothetical protein
MTTITAVPNGYQGSVDLTLTALPAGRLELWRYDANGSRRVRLTTADAIQETAGGSLVVTDQEPALVGDVSYSISDGSTTIYTDPAPIGWSGAPGVLLTVAADPSSWWMPGLWLEDWRMSRESGAQLHRIMDRTDPVDTGTADGPRTGQVVLLCDDWPQAYQLEQAIMSRDAYELQGGKPATRRVVMLRQAEHVGLDVLLNVERLELAVAQGSTSPRRWRVTLTGTETFTGPPLNA